jgi:hypothetical protein
MKAMQKQMDAYQANTVADREVGRENLQDMMKVTQEDIKSGQAEMRSAIGTIEENIDTWIAVMKDDLEETKACQYAMETSLKKMVPNSRE